MKTETHTADAPAATVVEGGIAKFPAGRTPDEARAEAEAAYGRAPTDRVYRIGPETSLDEVNALDIAPGATVLFRRGGVWRGQLRVRSGTPEHPVTYGAWGEGPAPVIQPSLDRSAPGDWRREPDGLWRAETGAATDVGNVVLDGGDAGCLFKRDARANVRRDLDFWFDPATGGVLVRSDAGDPAARWRSVELARKVHGVDEAGAHDVAYEGLAVRFGAAHGFGGGGVKRISIRGCEISWIGGGILYVDDLGNGVRYGNGIELWGSAEDVTVEGCRIWQCFDAGLTNQSNEPGSVQRNLLWKDNEVSDCEYSYEFWQQSAGGAAENVRLVGNVFRNAGGGWGREQRWNPSAAHLRFQDTTVPTPGFIVEGNRFSRSADVLARVFNDWRGQASFRNNVWESAGEPICLWHARPRVGLRFLCPDFLDRNHRDDRAEIEADGPGGRLFEATPEGFRAFETAFGSGPDEFRRVRESESDPRAGA